MSEVSTVGGTWLTRFGAFVFRYRDALFPVVVVVGIVIALPPTLDSLRSLPALGLVVGALSVLAGQALRMAVIGYAYIIRGGRDGKAYAERLVREGLFAHARHPMYTGNVLIAVGICLMWGTTFTMAVAIPCFLVIYYAMALNEEAFLIGKFGEEYRDYMASVPRFVPDFSGIRGSVSGFVYRWRRALRKDYGQVALSTSAVVILAAWRLRDVLPWAPTAGAVAMVLLVMAYVSVRRMKFRGRLDEPDEGAVATGS